MLKVPPNGMRSIHKGTLKPCSDIRKVVLPEPDFQPNPKAGVLYIAFVYDGPDTQVRELYRIRNCSGFVEDN